MAASLTGNPANWVDRRGAKRTVEMKVLMLGFHRTGVSIATHATAAMRTALKMLGFNDVHYTEAVFANPPPADMWKEAINAKFSGCGTPYGRAEWDQILGHCQAVTDVPSVLFAEDLVILTMRDPDKWWTSFSESIGVASASLAFRFAGILDPQGLGRGAVLSLLIIDVLVGPGTTEDSAKLRFVEHCERVRKIVPKEHLLEYEVKAGWDPLCSFLHVEVPAVEFPRTNDKQMLAGTFDDGP
ncbi:hypothetical protein B0H13DRAFT_2234827 [Mycena leptocephala]|nr:hypothetical protein B0H13DRAFT_2234827 [Mycena leptocephala]